MSLQEFLFAFLFLSVGVTGTADAGSIVFRGPPSFSNDYLNSTFPLPPQDYLYGQWAFGQSTEPSPYLNQFLDINPVQANYSGAPQQYTDIASFQTNSTNPSTLYAIYLLLTPLEPQTRPLTFINTLETRWTAARLYDVIAYGNDTAGVPFFVSYTTPFVGSFFPTPSGIFIFSRVNGGPTNATVQAIKTKIIGLDQQNLTTLANSLTPMANNGMRNISVPFICNATCQANNAYNR